MLMRISWFAAVADLGGAVGATTPFMMKTEVGAQFLARRVPLILSQRHCVFFRVSL